MAIIKFLSKSSKFRVFKTSLDVTKKNKMCCKVFYTLIILIIHIENTPCLNDTVISRCGGRESSIIGLYNKLTVGWVFLIPIFDPAFFYYTTLFRCGVLHVQRVPVPAAITGLDLALIHPEYSVRLPLREIAMSFRQVK